MGGGLVGPGPGEGEAAHGKQASCAFSREHIVLSLVGPKLGVGIKVKATVGH